MTMVPMASSSQGAVAQTLDIWTATHPTASARRMSSISSRVHVAI